MDRNTDRFWYDRGYRLGSAEGRRDEIASHLIFMWFTLGLAWVDLWLASGGVVLWTVSEVYLWRQNHNKAERQREKDDPGSRFEWE